MSLFELWKHIKSEFLLDVDKTLYLGNKIEVMYYV